MKYFVEYKTKGGMIRLWEGFAGDPEEAVDLATSESYDNWSWDEELYKVIDSGVIDHV